MASRVGQVEVSAIYGGAVGFRVGKVGNPSRAAVKN